MKKTKKKILMILANPFTNDPRVYNEALSLTKAGHDITVLAWDNSGKNPTFDKIKGINVFRSYNSSFMRLLPFDIFRLHAWWRKGYSDALKIYNNESFDIIHCHDLDTLPIGIKLKKKLDLPLIYDAHEIWGYMVSRDLPKPWANYYVKKEKKLLKYVDQIITVNKPLKDYFEKITDKPIEVIMNCKPLESRNYEPPKNDKFTLIYMGVLSKPRFLLELIDVVNEMSDTRLIICGGGKPDYVNMLKKKSINKENVDYLGVCPMNEVIPMTRKADLSICMTSPDDPNNSIAIANKQFEAMVCGRPIICTDGTYPGEFTKMENCGLVSLYSKEELKKTILKLKNNPRLCQELGKNALKSAINKFNWQLQEKKLLDIYTSFKD